MGFSFLFLIFFRRASAGCYWVTSYISITMKEAGWIEIEWILSNVHTRRSYYSYKYRVIISSLQKFQLTVLIEDFEWTEREEMMWVYLSLTFICSLVIASYYRICVDIYVCVEDCLWWKHLLLQARIRNTLQRRRIGHVALESLIHIRVWPLGVTLVWYSRIQP